ncbi:hypothetical protein CRUP_014710, partial [Coryphaenoides rupestris]
MLGDMESTVRDGRRWSLGSHEEYALQLADATNFYITEKNRNDIKNGSILRLTTSPSLMASQLHERIQSSSMDAKLEALKDLANSSRDITFAQEFINRDGISLLTQMVESGTEQQTPVGIDESVHHRCAASPDPRLCSALTQGQGMSPPQRNRLVGLAASHHAWPPRRRRARPHRTHSLRSVRHDDASVPPPSSLKRYQKLQKIMKPCFGDLLSFTLTAFVELMDHSIVSWDTFSVAFIKKTYTIAVINALFLKAPEEKRQSIIRSNQAINDEMAHQLYVLQVLTFNLLEDRMMTKMDPQDQAQRDIIFELRRVAFDVECEPSNGGSMEKRKSMYTRDYKKLGFIMVLENSSREDKHECPFGRSSIELTKMLCEILRVGEL